MKKIIVLIMVLVVSVWGIDSQALLKAQKEAQEKYALSKNVYQPIKLLDKAGIKEAIETKPKSLTTKQYNDLLKDYAKYHIYTNDDIMHGKNLRLAINLLTKVCENKSEDPKIYLLQARAYLKLFRFSLNTTMIPSTFYQHDQAYDESYTIIPPKMKYAYMKYVRLAKEQGIKVQLTKEEQHIINRDRMFIEWDSTFTGKQSWWPRHPKPKKYKEGFENICSEYVDMLNHMPDNNLTECSRYVNVDGSGFEFVIDVNIIPNKLKKYGQEHIVFKSISSHLVKYKNEYFLDTYGSLSLVKTYRKDKGNFCIFMYTDFNKEWQKNFSKCNQIENYKSKYPNRKSK